MNYNGLLVDKRKGAKLKFFLQTPLIN
jgi:hypothetical protein